ncbi:transglutaminase domain-containing protein [Saccharibacillus sp. CPCC 101409]|uniref:transglutaminase TgpA family protein n=1 Tax=Saccharibacillus sp. CPCC 101409 TaxID=3058041 RepID=UPI002671BBBC|nr:transglutaminaseTgpA domain-containing protein [Saccharibacillus sp. CPCC 101409]MDO3409081.1 transglutaminase domain-containing protein [Saccharibacillus sp. CPCC 101409]
MKKWSESFKSSWYTALSIVWLMVVAVQWLTYTRTVWFDETNALVLSVLTMAAVVHLLLPNASWLRLGVKAVAFIVVTYMTLERYGVFQPTGRLGERAEQFSEAMFPYVWFALGAWVLFEFCVRTVTSQRRILIFAFLNLVPMAALDSFTVVSLWKPVAWIVFATMGWLVCDHFRRFQTRFPKGWRAIRRNPFKLIVNTAVIFSLVILAGVNMPFVQPVLTDPYTAWRHLQGTSNVAFNSGGLLQGQASASGYSREDGQLGGGFNFDFTPVMTVESSERSYWRGETRMTYNGSGWEADSGWGTLEGVGREQDLERKAAPLTPTRTVRQRITMQSESSYPVLFGAFSISKVDSLDLENGESRMQWKSEQSELHWQERAGRGTTVYPKTYTIESEIPIVPVDKLKLETYSQLYPDGVESRYVQVPRGFPKRVTDLAEEIASEGETPYEKVYLLQQYLQMNYTYTNNPALSRKQSDDFVDSFLFEVKEGYCDYFSTAMVMMARSLDIPARWVKGYSPGNPAAGDVPERFTENSSQYEVTNANAHSWAEVYFGDYGWVPVEATRGFNMPLLQESSAPADAEVTQEQEQTPDTPEEQEDPAVQAAPEESDSNLVPIVVSAAAVVVAAWGLYLLWARRRSVYFFFMGLRMGGPLTADQKIVLEMERCLGFLKRKGLRREEHETLRESVSRWEKKVKGSEAALAPLLALFEKARYSPERITEAEWTEMQRLTVELRRNWKGYYPVLQNLPQSGG